MAKEKIKDVDKAFRDSHSKGIVFTDDNKYQQAKRKKLERRAAIKEASQQNQNANNMQREIYELKETVKQLIKASNKPKMKSKK